MEIIDNKLQDEKISKSINTFKEGFGELANYKRWEGVIGDNDVIVYCELLFHSNSNAHRKCKKYDYEWWRRCCGFEFDWDVWRHNPWLPTKFDM